MLFDRRTAQIRVLAAWIYRDTNPYFQMGDDQFGEGVEGMDIKELVNLLCGFLLQLADEADNHTRTSCFVLQ